MAVLNAAILPSFTRRALRRVSLLALCLALAVTFAPFGAEARPMKPVIHAGYRTLSASLPAERLMLQTGVWYPTSRKPVRVKAGNWSFRAARGGNILDGPWPVVILSHDVTGSAWSHHDMASALAARGFIVAAPLHDRDNADDMRMLFTRKQLPLRAMQASAALDAVLAHPQLGPQADRSRVGFLGFGMSASSALLLAGGRLSHEGWPQFVEAFAAPSSSASKSQDRAAPAAQTSPWCSPLLRGKMDALAESLERQERDCTERTSMRGKAVLARERSISRMQDSVSRSHQRQMRMAKMDGVPLPPVALPLLPPVLQDKPVTDSRFSAAVLVSPGFSMLFTRESLADVRIPLLVAGAGRDPFLLPNEQAERFTALLPLRPQYLLLPEASPAVLHAPCPEKDPASALGGVCTPVPDELRRSVQNLLLDTLHVFFLRAFGSGVEDLP
ncbi:alpha/beta hydrolase family protein [Mailhella sp.]|uniref:alpha/beta hydrolase family protein n=1 Tax=Mailhella sp. TaxID=1981029 RepID=UPI004063ADB6